MQIDVIRCPGHPDAVDLMVADLPKIDPIHLSAAEWREFSEAVKAGKYDHLTT